MSAALLAVRGLCKRFGGLQAATHLARAPVEVTLIDCRNFHLFQPLTYQIATGALSPDEVCYPLRAIFKRRRNVRVLLGEVTAVDLDGRTVRVQPGAGDEGPQSIPYDSLIAAGGSPSSSSMVPERSSRSGVGTRTAQATRTRTGST